MGVKGLWSLLEPVGHETSLETMENKILAIDVSIWLNQSIKGMRDKNDESRANSHCLGLFNKICKLLFYKIKPIFVFDGAVPILKKQTIEERKKNRIKNLVKVKQNTNKLLKSYLNQQLKKKIRFEDSNEEAFSEYHDDFCYKIVNLTSTDNSDLFQLPLSFQDVEESDEESTSVDYETISTTEQLQNNQDINIETEDFKSLPPSLRHEILTNMKENNKRLGQKQHLPQNSNDFSAFQMSRLLERRKLQAKIEEAEVDINKIITEKVITDNDDDIYGQKIAQRLVSDENTHFILLKKKNYSSSDAQLFKPSTSKTNILDKHSCSVYKNISEDISEFDYGKSEYIKTAKLTSLKCTISEKPKLNQQAQDQKVIMTKTDDNHVIFDNLKVNESKEKEKKLDSDADVDAEAEAEAEAEKTDETNETDSKSSFEEVHNVNTDTYDNAFFSKNELILNNQAIIKSNDNYNLNINFENSNLKLNYLVPCNKQVVNSEKNDLKEIITQLPSSIFSKEDKSELEKNLTTSKSHFQTVQVNQSFELSQPCITSPQSSTLSQKNAIKEEHFQQLSETSLQSSSNQLTSKNLNLKEKLKDYVQSLGQEKVEIESEIKKRERQSSKVMQSMIQDCQELLSLFGVPYLISPMEAEAQCATLEKLGLTNGTITDDSDVWLFGASTVFKNFFNQSKYVKMFDIKDIKNDLKLDRELMICIALITGSDYTRGLEGAGPVVAMEILSEFHGNGIEKLKNFKEWWFSKKANEDKSPGNKTRASFLKLNLNQTFPNPIVYKAYIDPVVDKSSKSFSWGIPDLDLLRKYALQKFNWEKSKVDDILLPVIKKIKDTSTQTRVNSYFKRKIKDDQEVFISKRLTKALDKFKNDQESSLSKRKDIIKKKLKKASLASSKSCSKKSFQNKVKVDITLSEDTSETD